MARTQIPVTLMTRAGVTEALQVLANLTEGNYFANDGQTAIQMENTDGSAHNVGFAIFTTVDGSSVADKNVALPASIKYKWSGPYPIATYNRTDNTVYVNPDSPLIKFRAFQIVQ